MWITHKASSWNGVTALQRFLYQRIERQSERYLTVESRKPNVACILKRTYYSITSSFLKTGGLTCGCWRSSGCPVAVTHSLPPHPFSWHSAGARREQSVKHQDAGTPHQRAQETLDPRDTVHIGNCACRIKWLRYREQSKFKADKQHALWRCC